MTTITLTDEQVQTIPGKAKTTTDRRVERHKQTAQDWKVRYYATYKDLKAARIENHDLKRRLREGSWA